MKTDYQIDGCDALQLHHLYRAMAWLGEELPRDQQAGKTPFAPRCTKDRIEEGVFDQRRDLFTELQLVFFDTTSIYFEGEGGQDIGQRGRRPTGMFPDEPFGVSHNGYGKEENDDPVSRGYDVSPSPGSGRPGR